MIDQGEYILISVRQQYYELRLCEDIAALAINPLLTHLNYQRQTTNDDGKINIDQDHVKNSSNQNKSPVEKTSTVVCDQSRTWCNTARYVHNAYFRVAFRVPVPVFTLTVALCMGRVHRPIFAGGLLE